MRSIRAMHWNNIHADIVAGQKGVLNALGYDIRQDAADRVRHGSWLNTTLEAADENETILFLDIDAFPSRASRAEAAKAP